MKSCLILLALISASKYYFSIIFDFNKPTYLLYFGNWTGYALNCQVCGNGSGICENADDNGVSMECPPEAKACWYGFGSKFHFNCILQMDI